MFTKTIHLFNTAYSGLPKTIWLLSAAMFINRMGTMVFPYLSLYLTESLHFPLAQAGVVLGIYGLGALCGTLMGGFLTDRFGYQKIQILSLLFAGIMLLALMFLSNFISICIFIFIYTTLADTFRPANSTAIAANSNETTRTRSFTLNRLAINLGWSIGAGLGGFLAFYNYKLLFLIDGITCIFSGLFLWYYLGWHSVEASVSTSAYQKPIKKDKSPFLDVQYLMFSFLVVLFAMAFFLLFSVLPVYFKQVRQLTELQIGLLQTLNGIIIVVFEMFLIMWLERRFPKHKIIAFGLFFTGFSYLILNFSAANFVVLWALIFVTLGEMFAMPFMMSSTVERSSVANRGKYLSIYGMSYSIAQIVSPLLGTWLAAHYGYTQLWYLVFGMCVLGAVGFWRKPI